MSRTRKPPVTKSLTAASIEGIIHTVRGERVILDADLARIYGVETKVLNQAAKRNHSKFPPDFLFELTAEEVEAVNHMRSQIVIASKRNVRYRPFAFTEHGALMAATILNSPQGTQMSVFVMRAFVKMRALLTATRELAKKLASVETELKSRLDVHETAIVEVLQRIMLLLDPPSGTESETKEMGFHANGSAPTCR